MSKRRGKMVKRATYGLSYGGSVEQVVKTSGLSRRRVRVLKKRLVKSAQELREGAFNVFKITVPKERPDCKTKHVQLKSKHYITY